MKVSHGCAGVLLLGCLIAGVWSCGEGYKEKQAREEKDRKAAIAKEEAQRAQTMTEFSKTYNADTTWPQSLEGKPLVTLELQNALIRQDGRPIIAVVNLFDVEKVGDKYRLRLAGHDLLRHARNEVLVFDLTCSLVQGTQLNIFDSFLPPDATEGNYLVAARVKSVQSTFFWQAGESRKGGLSQLIKQSTATGECLGFHYIGDDVTAPDEPSIKIKKNPLPRR